MGRLWIDPEELAARIDALAVRFQAGEFSEEVYRASLFALSVKPWDIDDIVRQAAREKYECGNRPKTRPPDSTQ